MIKFSKKEILTFMTACLVSVSLCACGGNEPEKVQVDIDVNKKTEAEAVEEQPAEKIVDAKAIADSLKNDIKYKDELNEIDLETAAMFYDFSSVEIEEAYIYESSGATAEEIVVIKCKDSDNAKKVKALFDSRVDEQMESFESYIPEEVVKLKEAVIITSKEYAVLSVSDDASKAKDIIEKGLLGE